MPSTVEHFVKATSNESFALSLSLDSQAGIDWALTAIFYSAVHYVEAYYAKYNVHHATHARREKVLSTDPNLKEVFGAYQELKYFGHAARYDPPRFKAQDVHSVFPRLAAIKRRIDQH